MPRPPSPTTPSFSISALNAENPEGDTGTTMFTFTVTRTSGKGGARVNYAVTGAEADDFTGGLFPSGTILFRNGETSITISIPVAGDILAEQDETFSVTLSNPAGGTIATGTATGTIQNDDFTIQRVSVDSAGVEANNSSLAHSISDDGRYVVFSSLADNLVPGDTNGHEDIFVRDLELGTTTRINVDTTGGQANNFSSDPSISADGRYVAFRSAADNLVEGDTNETADIFVHDLHLGTTTRVSVGSGGAQANGDSTNTSISADGRYVAFASAADNLVTGDTNGTYDVFVFDRQVGTNTLVSVDSAGAQANTGSSGPSISADGRYVAFSSGATNLGDADGGVSDIFVRDLLLGTTTHVSVDAYATGPSGGQSITADGRYITFTSFTSGLFAADVFVFDRELGTTTLVSVDSTGGGRGNDWSIGSSISDDGRYVAFSSLANNLVAGDTNGVADVFVRDLQLGTTRLVSIDPAGIQGNNYSFSSTSISADGRYLTFNSDATNLVAGDTNGTTDTFVVDGLVQGWWLA